MSRSVKLDSDDLLARQARAQEDGRGGQELADDHERDEG